MPRVLVQVSERSNRWHTDMCSWKHQLKVGLVIRTSLAQVIDWLPAWLPFAVQPPAVDNPCGVVPRHVPFQGG